MRNYWKGTALALGLAGAAAMTIPNAAFAAPAAGGAPAVKAAVQALPGGVTDVRWRGRRGSRAGAAIVGGLAAGILGAAAANAYGPRYYYPEPYYYYGRPYGYYGPRYHSRRHWRHRHW
jgi:hypothetical protein